MRLLRIRVSSDARAQINEVAAWWRANRKAARGLFRAELADALDSLTRSPDLGTAYHDVPLPNGQRLTVEQLQARMLRTRYHLYYTIDLARGEVFIRALWHTSRGDGPPIR